ncbi:apolipoprotein N-acyltransferase [candidate division WOR-1 bacterium RIFOXYC2_FULL_37_10]|uniref:Apolipoprotein N-acyltransferase n=1 Tax=candidate division WOR-1 bacterium RIFOXYB2_FULL_37_13 TaxID=1802579 RepID=A0A1F4SNA9_UNCSA|nr:MAG: apolipoprotein N-acyltransferase [candidate division WOR-1 bacterium RIFOXYB2_FULL_37_13]OGC37259.1 MAG: apolipoprotein N-acyltransferase [candidate division WOR-1 bacterium RIFOXYC2_FULL_37_10]
MNFIYVIFSGVLLSAAFPKVNFFFVAWVALVPFFIAVEKSKNAKSAALLGFLFGLSLFSINLFWVNTLFLYVGFWAILGWACLIAFQSIYLFIYAYIIKRFGITLSIWTAVLWVLIEAIRGMGDFGIPGGVVGYSQVLFLPLIQIASFSTVYGVSFLIIIFNIGLAKIFVRKEKISSYTIFGLSLILMFISIVFGFFELDKETKYENHIKVSIIQGNIPQEKKLDPRFNNENFLIHKELTLKAANNSPQIIIWPETSIFTYLLYDKKYLTEVEELAKKTKAFLFIGTPHYDRHYNVYNSIAVFSQSGEVIGRYDKQHLVPFGEYLPFKPVLYPILKNTGYYNKDFTPGTKINPIEIMGIKIGTAICFESTFPFLIKKQTKMGADFFIVITNDAWFKFSSAPYEHFDYAIFRAIENRKFLIQAANTGISGLIDPYGRILNKLDLNKQGYLTVEIPVLSQ